MDKEQIDVLVEKYFVADGHVWPDWMSYEYSDNQVRYDYDSSKICYSLIRHFKPTAVFECGTSFGHSTIFINDALRKNGLPYTYVGVEKENDLLHKTLDNLKRRYGKVPPNITVIRSDVMDKKVLEYIPQKIDFAFIDTDHGTDVTQWHIDNIFPRMATGDLVAIHDFAVDEIDGLLVGKGGRDWDGKKETDTGGLPETQLLMNLLAEGTLPLKKLYWMYPDRSHYPAPWEGSFWTKK